MNARHTTHTARSHVTQVADHLLETCEMSDDGTNDEKAGVDGKVMDWCPRSHRALVSHTGHWLHQLD